MSCRDAEEDAAQKGIQEEVRRQLALLSRRSNARSPVFTRQRPTDWRPTEVRDPRASESPHQTFTKDGAWEFIASKLEEGHKVEKVQLQQPPGKTGYVMKIELAPDLPTLYVKLELGSGKIWGRSFHYSEY